VLLDHQRRGGRQLADALEEGARGGHEAAREVVVEGDAVDRGRDEPGGEQRPDLRGERHSAAVGPPVERLDPVGVAGRDEAAPARVPESEGEDPAEPAHALEPVLLVGVHDHLAVGVRREAVPALLQQAAQVELVVDLAVDDGGDLAVLGVERLVAAGDVDDRKPGMGERERSDPPERVPVGTAVAQGLHHSLGRVGPRRAGRIEDCSDPAHAR
jgi:hypothetical protein